MYAQVDRARIIVPSRESLELRALHLLRECDIVTPPVPVEDVARHVGIVSIAIDDIQKAAILMALPGGHAGVILRRADPPRRRRFSLAHEIGHRVVHPNVGVHDFIAPIAARSGFDRLEHAMNYFAACLLMPRTWVCEWHRSGATVKEIATVLDVSVSAASARIREVGS